MPAMPLPAAALLLSLLLSHLSFPHPAAAITPTITTTITTSSGAATTTSRPFLAHAPMGGKSGTNSTSTTLHLLAVGDWGGTDLWPYFTVPQWMTAGGMAGVARMQHSASVLALGDNFYYTGLPDGGGDEAARRFRGTFETVYRQAELRRVPWYVTAGNHDYLGNLTGQLEYTDRDGRWNYPDLFYSVRLDLGGGGQGGGGASGPSGPSVEVVVIDTVVLAGMPPASPASAFGPLSGPASPLASEEHWDWIERRLSASTADYLLVAGHYPVYSACSHGSTPVLVERLDPLLRRYGVTAYLSGHDHCQMHVRRGGIDHVLTGTGDGCCYGAERLGELPPDAELAYLLARGINDSGVHGGFAGVGLDRDGAWFALHDHRGRVLHRASLPGPRGGTGSGAWDRWRDGPGDGEGVGVGAAATAATAAER